MANFIEKTLESGEQIIYKGSLHWYFNFRYTVWGVILNILGLAWMIKVGNSDTTSEHSKMLLIVCFALCIIGVVSILYGCLLRAKTEFAITSNRFIQKDGLLNIKITEIPLFKVETVNFEQTLIERIVSTGSIQLVGSGGTNHTIRFIKKPFEVRNLITANMKKEENGGAKDNTTV